MPLTNSYVKFCWLIVYCLAFIGSKAAQYVNFDKNDPTTSFQYLFTFFKIILEIYN